MGRICQVIILTGDSIKRLLQCLNFQQISPLITTSTFPHEESFFLQRNFCETASKVLTTSCKNPNKKYFLDVKYNKLCSLLEIKKILFEKVDQSLCSNWPDSFLTYLQNQTGIAWLNIDTLSSKPNK